MTRDRLVSCHSISRPRSVGRSSPICFCRQTDYADIPACSCAPFPVAINCGLLCISDVTVSCPVVPRDKPILSQSRPDFIPKCTSA